MRIEALECFHEVMKSGSIRQAAGNRYISQQGLSKIIQSLEAELGTTLFQKSGRNVVPTREALLLDEFAKEVIAGYGHLLAQLNADAAGEGGASPGIVLHTTAFVANAIFNMLRPEMDEEQIGIDQLIIREDSLDNILEMFFSGKIDFALLNISEADYRDMRSAVDTLEVFVADIVLMVPRNLAATIPGRRITPEVLVRLPVAYYNDGVLNRLVRRFCESADVEQPVSLMHSTNISSIHDMVNTGRAVTFSDTFSLTMRNAMEDAIPMALWPPQRFVVCFLISPKLDDSSPQRRYASRFKEMFFSNHGAFLRDSFIDL